MRFSRLHKLVTYLIAGLGLYALTLGTQLDTFSIALIVIGYLGSFFVEGPVLQRPGYTKLWNRLVVGFFVVQIARGLLGGPLLSLGIEYAAFLQLSRLFHRKTAKDHQHIAVLSFLHLIAATVLTTGLDYGVIFFGFVVVTPWMLALTHLRSEIEGNYREGSRAATDVRRVLASRRVAGPGFLLATASLAIPLFVVTAALFLLFPRVGMGFLSFGTQTGQRVAGFGRNVQLGGFGVIRDDPTVVLRVQVPETQGGPGEADEDGAGEADRGSLALPLRLRGTSFDRYDGRQWTRSTTRSKRIPHTFGQYPILRWPEDDDRRLRIVLDPLDERVVFLPRGTVALGVEPRVERGREVSRRLERSPGLDIRYVGDGNLGLRYDAYVSDDPKDRMYAVLEAEERARYLQMPDDHERVIELARRVTADARTDAERAEAVHDWLAESGELRYTLRQPDTRGRAPLEAFLFEARAGHCEYFSTAMAIMLRAVGIPARNVTGFVGGRYNPYGGYYAIRQGDAHSWVEAYVDGRWQSFDPTPPARHGAGPSEGVLGTLRAIVDAMRVEWSQHVVDYDLRDQHGAFRRFARWLGSLRGTDGERGAPEGDEAAEPSAPEPSPWLVAIAVAAALLLALAVAWWRRRRRRPRGGGTRRGDHEAVALYRELERALGRAGRPRSPEVTPLEHAGQLAGEGFAGAEAVREVTQAYLQARFAGEPLGPDRAAGLRARIRRDLSPRELRRAGPPGPNDVP